MLKLVKYEYRKCITAYVAVLAVLCALEAYFLGALALKSENNIVIAAMLLLLLGSASVFIIMIIGISQYSKELSSKTSYMTFMTPRSVYEIVGAKYLTLLFTTVAGTVILIVFGYIDVKYVMVQYPDMEIMMEIIDEILAISVNKKISQLFVALAALVFEQWLSIFFTVSLAYLAITLSSTILSDKRGKGWLSVALFFAITIATSIISGKLPVFDFGDGLVQMLLGMWPALMFEILMIVATYFVVSELLKRKVSL